MLLKGKLGTIMPIICASDETHLTNYSGDKSAWPVYITIGNLSSKARNTFSSHGLLLLGLLPITPKHQSLSEVDKSRIRTILQDCVYELLSPLSVPSQEGVILKYADEKEQICFSRLAAWIADHKEYVSLLNIYHNACTVCEAPQKTLGNHENPSGYWQYHTYETLKAELGSSSTAADRKKEI